MEEVKHDKCPKCKCYRTLPLFLNAKGRKLKTCQKCRDRGKKSRDKNKCEHNRQRSQCKECGGASICKHNRRRTTCKECGGGSICNHGRQRNQCKECDPCGHLSTLIANRCRNAIKSKNTERKMEYLRCTIEEFKNHLESKFKDGMTWDNHGEWHIDHIIPLKYGKPSLEETIKRLHWTNTQPLWAVENMSKGNKYIG